MFSISKILFPVLIAIPLFSQAQFKQGKISQAYGSRIKLVKYAITRMQKGSNYTTQYKFGDFTITAINKKSESQIYINIRTQGILGANDNLTIPYDKCNGYVLYKGGAANLLGSSKLEYLLSFTTTEKTFVAVNQVMDAQTDRYHYVLDPLNQQLYAASKKIWTNCQSKANDNQAQVIKTNTYSDYNSLKVFKDQSPAKIRFFNNQVVKNDLLRILGGDYQKFQKGFTNTRPTGNSMELINNVLFTYQWSPHYARNYIIYFIDLKDQKSFLYWNEEEGRPKVYGDVPLTSNIIAFINDFSATDRSRYQEGEHELLLSLLQKYGRKETGESADSEVTEESKDLEDEVFSAVEASAEFPGGQVEFLKYLTRNIEYPEEAKLKNIHGRVYVSFVIDAEGNPTKAKILRGIGGGCDEEVLRVINNSPKWKPAMMANRPTRQQITIPISF